MKFSDLSENEKAAVQEFWSKCPEKRTTSGDPNDPTLGRFEESIVDGCRHGPDFILDVPVANSPAPLFFSPPPKFPSQKFYCANCGHPDSDHQTRPDTSCSNVVDSADATKQYCQCKAFVVEDVLPLSEHEKAMIQDMRENIPGWLSPERDLNDPNLSNQEKALILVLREANQITFDEPVEASSMQQTFLVNPDVEQKYYCANCGLELKRIENGNFEFACDCAEAGKKYNFPLITQDENEHIRRKQLKNG